VTLLSLAAAATTIVAANLVEVRSGTNCPSTEEIVAKLSPMLPNGSLPGPPGDMAFVEVVESRADGVAELHLQLLRSDNSVVVDRRLRLQASCAEMAEAIATFIATWETNPQLVTPLPIPPQPAASLPTVPPGQGESPVTKLTLDVSGADQSKIGRLTVSLGASAGIAMIGGMAATGSLEAIGGRVASRWQLRVSAAFETTRQQMLDIGTVSWRHTTATAGIMLRSLGPAWRFSVDAGPVFGWATLSGDGYTEDNTQSVFEYGAGTGLRIERTIGRLSLWLDWRTDFWPMSQQAVLTGPTSRAKLSNFDMMASLGVSMMLF
jgi:hypothetical protein